VRPPTPPRAFVCVFTRGGPVLGDKSLSYPPSKINICRRLMVCTQGRAIPSELNSRGLRRVHTRVPTGASPRRRGASRAQMEPRRKGWTGAWTCGGHASPYHVYEKVIAESKHASIRGRLVVPSLCSRSCTIPLIRIACGGKHLLSCTRARLTARRKILFLIARRA